MKPQISFAPSSRRGFTLIVTVSLMVLLVILGLGMLSLSSTALRSSSNSMAMKEARQNARLAMILAIGQLQLLSGQDTRITAPRLPTNANTATPVVPVTGVWRSWEGGDREPNGKPKIPNYDGKRKPGDPFAAPNNPNSGRFLGWLTSSSELQTPDPNIPPDVKAEMAVGYVKLVAGGSSTDTARHVYTKPAMINGNQGSIAWWTSGDNSKARINARRTAKPTTTVQWQEQIRSNERIDATYFNLPSINDVPPAQEIASNGSLELLNSSADLKKIHDITSFSRGLLTNASTGGWKRDLSLFSESYGSLPATGLPLLSLQPGKIQTYSKAPSSGNVANPLLYPWTGYRNNAAGSAWQQVPPISSWTALIDYMTQYKNLNSASSVSRTAMDTFTGGTGTSRFAFVDQVRRMPQLARIHWIYSICSTRIPNPPDPNKPFKAGLMITPVVTLWNPYNVELRFTDFDIRIQQTTPLRFRFQVGSTLLPDTSLREITIPDLNRFKEYIDSYQSFVLKIPADTLRPGATRIYGVNDPTPKIGVQASNTLQNVLQLAPGYQPNGGFMFFGINNGAEVYANGTDRYRIDRVSYDGLTWEGGRDGTRKTGIGIVYDLVYGSASLSHRMVYNVPELGGQNVATALYPPLNSNNLPSTTIANVEGRRNLPFASAIFAYRMASPPSRDVNKHRHQYTKGMLQASPLVNYTEIGFGDDGDAITSMKGTGVYHPVNAPYDFSFVDVIGGWNDNLSIPQFDRTTNSSYIGSGMAPSDGLTRCVMAELPTRPLQSLVDLQHFDARNNNPIPPFHFNLLGNGSAHPIFAPDQISITTSFNNNMCNDDCYMLNQLFFDDWFVSSIAPALRDHQVQVNNTSSVVYRNHLELTKPLPNRNYLPSPDASVVNGKTDVTAAVSSAVSAAKNRTTGMYSFETIASKLQVDGMFNVNSISLDAWKALLRQSRDIGVPYLDRSGRTLLDKTTLSSYPRSSIAGDRATNSNSQESNPAFPQAAEFAGHRVLTDEQIDALAEEIVKEIRKRGPFLSLAEFVNRRLDANAKDLAIASAIQKALDNLAELGSSSKNPYRVLQENSVKITSPPPGNTHDYKFPEAALGWSSFGFPGWIRQADILRPLAPSLSVRDDTFTIRAYGDARDRNNPAKIMARAWCEVVVMRQAEYVDPVDSPEVIPHSSNMKSNINRQFGRRYQIVSFRWLNDNEI